MHTSLSEQCILPRGGCTVVSVLARISGRYNGVPANGTFRFMRTWASEPESAAWRVIVASLVMVV